MYTFHCLDEREKESKILRFSSFSFFFFSDVPVCENHETRILGASLGEIVHVLCSVIADPGVSTFKWVFNNSAQSLVVPREKYTMVNSTTSKLGYKLTSNKDFGTLTCWTKNVIGEQIKPCTFYVIRAGTLAFIEGTCKNMATV